MKKSEILEYLEWAMNTITDQEMFGSDELSAARSRELRARGVMREAYKFIKEHVEEEG